MRRLLLLTALVWLARAAAATACASCGCGDPTLTAMGAEKPFQGRLRASLELRHRTDALGRPRVDRVQLRELRLDAQLAWAPWSWVFLGVTVPALWRTARYVNLAERTTVGLGDIEARAKFFVYASSAFAPRHLLALTGGVKLATAARERAANGELLPTELQPGSGSLDPLGALSYAYFPRPWSFYASLQGTYPGRGTGSFRASPSLRTTTTVQLQLVEQLAVRLGIDTRVDGKAYDGGEPDRDSGGLLALLSPELLYSPGEDVLLYTSVRVPVLNRLAGYHDEGVFLGGGVAVDF